jgi:hypothetical protein
MNSHPPSNRLLLSLPPRDLKELAPKLEFIRCEPEQILLDVDALLDHVFFPNSGVISAVADARRFVIVFSAGDKSTLRFIGANGQLNRGPDFLAYRIHHNSN